MDTWLIVLIVIICVIIASVPLIAMRWKYVNSAEYRSKEVRKADQYDKSNTFFLANKEGIVGDNPNTLTTAKDANKKRN